MRLLLDTHVLLWWFTDDPRLPAKVRHAIADEGNALYTSAASAWEVATQARLGKLDGVPDVTRRWPELLAADGITPLPIDQRHALRAGRYPQAHRDPFDRLLAAQSEIESRVLVTADPALPAFGCEIFWQAPGLRRDPGSARSCACKPCCQPGCSARASIAAHQLTVWRT